jgi:cell envelope opacity-associated protein A
VGTTVKRADRFPTDVVADEKQSWLQGERVYIATTAGQECRLGASIATSAGQADVTEAYGVFAEEAQAVAPDEAPETVHTDGWQPTQGAWKALVENVTLIRCFLQACLNIRDRTTQALGAVGQAVYKRVWDAYPAPRKRAFSQRVRRLKAWAENA